MTPIDPVLQCAQSLSKKNYTLLTMGEAYLVLWTQIEIFFKVDKSWHFLWNVKHFSMFLGNIRIAKFEIYGLSHSIQMKNKVV